MLRSVALRVLCIEGCEVVLHGVMSPQQAKALDRLQKEMEALRKQLMRQRDGLQVNTDVKCVNVVKEC